MSEKKPENWLWHLFGLLNPIIVIIGNILGGFWTLMGFIFTLILGPIFDVSFGKGKEIRPPRSSGVPFKILLWMHVLLHGFVLCSLFWLAWKNGLNIWLVTATISTGLHSGASAIITAHELGHSRRGSISWKVSRILLFSVNYTHFTTEHNYNHHKWVATDKDPASAKEGESIYGFVFRTIPQQYLSAAKIQARKGNIGINNPVHRGLSIQLLVLIILFVIPEDGFKTIGIAWIIQSFVAIFLLEYVNYIRHYGLRRKENERLQRSHSWQSEARWSRWTLLELTRHSHHHMEANKPFWELISWDDAPHLPAGYYACFWPCMIPPIWRNWMKKHIPISNIS